MPNLFKTSQLVSLYILRLKLKYDYAFSEENWEIRKMNSQPMDENKQKPTNNDKTEIQDRSGEGEPLNGTTSQCVALRTIPLTDVRTFRWQIEFPRFTLCHVHLLYLIDKYQRVFCSSLFKTLYNFSRHCTNVCAPEKNNKAKEKHFSYSSSNC